MQHNLQENWKNRLFYQNVFSMISLKSAGSPLTIKS